jgi:wobble nucleotide-excising tRNase
MIRRINRIKQFGVFGDFSWGDLPEFTSKNILYGWNYSGKTTLSRILSCIENNAMHIGYEEAEFEITFSNGKESSTLASNSFGATALTIRVFNEDFIRQNLKWDGTEFNPILLLGREDREIEEKIKQNKLRILNYKHRKETTRARASQIYIDYESKLTDMAYYIKSILKLGTFTKIHLRPIVQTTVGPNYSNCLIKDDLELQKFITDATSDDKLDLIDTIESLDLNIEPMMEHVVLALGEIPSTTKVIQRLVDNEILSKWVKDGLFIHEDKDECEFCGNKITKTRINELQEHFSKEYSQLVSKLERLEQQIKEKIINLRFTDRSRFYKKLQEPYETKLKELETEILNYNRTLDVICDDISHKYKKMFETVQLSQITYLGPSVDKKIQEINDIINEHNDISKQFEATKQQAVNKLQKHYAAQFIRNNNYFDSLREEDILIRLAGRYEKRIADIIAHNEVLEAQISAAHRGKDELNAYIIGFLGRDELKIDIVSVDGKDKFTLKRNDKIALNLSGGEKTAIALSYFLTKLKEDKIEDCIVWIDDPVSSLDSNHIYHVFALISNVFFNENKLLCKQIFVSTHNFEFYNLLKDSNQFAVKSKQTGKYLIRRLNKTTSKLLTLPKQLELYKSEYQYLFKILYDFSIDENKDDNPFLLALPNVIRKFLESYTSARLPKSIGLEDRIRQLFLNDVTSKEILKFIHSHSHFIGIMQQGKHDDTIYLCETIVSHIIDWLKNNDQMHYQALLDSVKDESLFEQ